MAFELRIEMCISQKPCSCVTNNDKVKAFSIHCMYDLKVRIPTSPCQMHLYVDVSVKIFSFSMISFRKLEINEQNSKAKPIEK